MAQTALLDMLFYGILSLCMVVVQDSAADAPQSCLHTGRDPNLAFLH